MIDTQRLRVWRAVVASGSVQAAARHLGYTPSTVSQHVHQLQRESGLVLIERVGRGIKPTAAGLALATQAEEVLLAHQRLEAAVGDLREGRTEELAISCLASVAHVWVPRVAERLHQELPGLVLEVSINEPHGGPGRRAADLEVRSEPATASSGAGQGSAKQRQAQSSAMVRQVLCEESYVLAVRGDSPLAGGEQVRLADLAHEPWIDNVVYQNPTLEVLLDAARAAGIAPRWAARCDDHQSALGMVAAGIGITALPALAARHLPEGVVTRPLVDPTPRRRLVAWQRSSTAHTEASRLALAVLHELARADQPLPPLPRP